jgi:pilus assembly protein CpaF
MTPQYPTAPPAPPAPVRQAQTQTAPPPAPPQAPPQAAPPQGPPPAAPQAPARPGHVGTPAGAPPVASRWGDAQRAAGGSAGPVPNQRLQVLEDLRQKMHQFVISELGPILYDQRVSEADLRKQVEEQLHKALSQERHALTGQERQNLVQSVFDDVLGYGPIDRLLRDPTITEIMVNGPQSVYVERKGKIQLSDVQFVDETHVRRIIDKIVSQVGRRVDEATPMVDARLPDGSRVNCIIHPLAIGGPFLTIRRFSADPYKIEDLINFGSVSPQSAQFIDACVRGRLNVVVSGGTGTGKTTMLNVLSSFIPEDERIITIEDAKELQLQQPHVLCLEARPPNIEGKGEVKIRELVRNALRMRPDRVVVGECRGAEALDMLQAMNTGHDGSITTIHSNSPRDTLSRVETMTLMAGMELPVRVIREQMASALDLIVHLSRLRDGTRRVTHISEVMGMEGDVIVLQDLYMFDYGMGIDEDGRFLGELKSTGIRPGFTERLANNGVTLESSLFAVPDGSGFARRGGARR